MDLVQIRPAEVEAAYGPEDELDPDEETQVPVDLTSSVGGAPRSGARGYIRKTLAYAVPAPTEAGCTITGELASIFGPL